MLATGTQIGGYVIEGVLGHGGMGVVYEARQVALDRKVALKLLAPQLGLDPSFSERFRHEGRIQAAIDHPHIVTVYEAGEIEEGMFLAMRLIRGPNLKDLIIGRELEGARTLRILTPIADALDTAHEAGLIHRDVKPQNILVGARDHAYLADFGLTKGADDVGLTRTGQFVGTIDYITPEQIRGEQASACSDVYALAAVLYECLTGVVPYPKPSDAAVMYAHLSDPPPLVTEQRPDLPPTLDDVIAKGMAKNPADRYPTAGELVAQAERAFGRRIRAVITPPGPLEGPEETGIRDPEGKVPTRPTRVRNREMAEAEARGAAEPTVLDDQPAPPPQPTTPAPPAAPPPSETVAAPPPPPPSETVAAPPPPPPSETVAAPAGETAAAPPPPPSETVAAPAGETAAAPPPPPSETVAAPAGETAAAPAPPADETVAAPVGETAAAPAPPSSETSAVPAPPADETVAAPVGETAAAPAPPADETVAAPVGETAAAPAPPADETVAASAPPTGETAAAPAREEIAPPTGETAAAPAREEVASPAGETAPARRRPARPARRESAPRPAVPAGPPPAPAEPFRPRPRPAAPPRTAAIAAAGVLALVAAVAGFVLGRPGDKEAPAPPALVNSASTVDVSLRFPAGWDRRSEVPEIPGLVLAGAMALGPAGVNDAGLEAGRSDGAGPTLLPAAFLKQLEDAPEPTDRVRLGRLQALRYKDLQPRGFDGRRVTVYAVPTSRGVATLACWGGEASFEDFAPTCERVASSLGLLRAEPFELGPDPAYATALDKTMGTLDQRRSRQRGRLRQSGSARTQSTVAGSLAAAYREAARVLRRQRPTPEVVPANGAIAAALDEATGAYERLESAARGRDRAGYSRAARAVNAAEKAVESRLGELERLGYKVS